MTPYGPALALLLRVPIDDRGDLAPSLDRRVRLIVQAAHLADVDPAELLAVCVLESGLRVRSPRASLCGCQPYATDDATQATCAARSYAAGLDRCGTPEGAVSRYVWGRCAPGREDGRSRMPDADSTRSVRRRQLPWSQSRELCKSTAGASTRCTPRPRRAAASPRCAPTAGGSRVRARATGRGRA